MTSRASQTLYPIMLAMPTTIKGDMLTIDDDMASRYAPPASPKAIGWWQAQRSAVIKNYILSPARKLLP